MFVSGGAGNLTRKLSSSDLYSYGRWFGTTVAAGCCGGGGIAFWISRSDSSHIDGAPLLFFASFTIGYLFRDLEKILIKVAIRKVYTYFGITEDIDDK